VVAEETVPDVTKVFVVLEVTTAVVVDDDVMVVAVEAVPVLLDGAELLDDEIGLLEEVVWRVVAPLAVRAVEEPAAELEAVELGAEEIDDEEVAEVAGVDREDVVAPLVAAAVVELWFAVAPGNSVANPRARTKVTMTATVAPAAICLLNSDNCTRVGPRRYRPTF